MELFTIIAIASVGMISLWNAIIWEHKGFLNFTIKISFIIAVLLSMNLILVPAGINTEPLMTVQTYMYFSAGLLGTLGFTWSTKGTLNIGLKFIHMLIALTCAAWLMIHWNLY